MLFVASLWQILSVGICFCFHFVLFAHQSLLFSFIIFLPQFCGIPFFSHVSVSFSGRLALHLSTICERLLLCDFTLLHFVMPFLTSYTDMSTPLFFHTEVSWGWRKLSSFYRSAFKIAKHFWRHPLQVCVQHKPNTESKFDSTIQVVN